MIVFGVEIEDYPLPTFAIQMGAYDTASRCLQTAAVDS